MSTEWYVFAAGRQTGPFSAQDLATAPDDALVWREGMSEWAPKSTVFPKSDTSRPPVKPPIPPQSRACCADESCVGVIGANGRCGTCGRTAEEARRTRANQGHPESTATGAHKGTAHGTSGSGLAVASLVIGIVSLIIGAIPFCGAWAILPAIVGLVLGIVAYFVNKKAGKPRSMAVAGIVLCTLAMIVMVVVNGVLPDQAKKSEESAPNYSSPLAPVAQPSRTVPVPSREEQEFARVLAAEPDPQRRFKAVVEEIRSEYKTTNNELVNSALRTDRGKKMRDLFSDQPIFEGWIGRITTLKTTGEGKAYLNIRLPDTTAKLKTWNNELSDIGDETLISQSSPLYDALSGMSEGDIVRVSGDFVHSKRDKDFLKESSLTEAGSIQEPEYVVRFRSVEAFNP
jgi:hypothetical protein